LFDTVEQKFVYGSILQVSGVSADCRSVKAVNGFPEIDHEDSAKFYIICGHL